MKYKLSHEGYVWKGPDTKVPITGTEKFPNTNPDYLEYLEWLAAGGIPEPADPLTPEVPSQVSPAQARLALLQVGKLAQVEQLLASLPEPTRAAALIEWEFAGYVARDHGLVAQLASALGMTEAETDDLFILAATL